MSLFLARLRFCQARGTNAMQTHGPQGRRGNPHMEETNMDSTIERSVRGLALFSVLAGTMALATGHVASAAEADGQAQHNSQARRIQGAWVLEVTVVDCATGNEVGRTFRSLLTFAQGGTLTNTTTGINPALRTPGLGTWARTGEHTFSALTVVFLFNPAGAWTMTQTIANMLEIGTDPDELTGTTEVRFFNTRDIEIPSMRACATVLGSRLD
jgi:hypothetical protein